MSKKRIAIILELKNRELPYFVLLKELLEKQGHTVKIISFRSACSVQLLLFRPDIVLVNGLRSYDSYIKQMYIPKKLFGATIVCLYSEQIVYSKVGSIAETYNNQKILKAVDFHITWGKTFADALVQIGIPAEKIWILGSLQNDLKYYFAKSVQELKQDFAKQYGLDARKTWSIIADNVLPSMEKANYEENRACVDGLIMKIASDNPDVEFIFRMHPETEQTLRKKIEDKMKKCSNVHSIGEGHIYIWSVLCHNMIVAFSTSSITALLNGKNVFSIKLPNAIRDSEVFEKYYWNRDIMEIYTDLEKCAKDISDDMKGFFNPDPLMKKKKDEYIKGFYYKVDGNIFNRYIYFFDNIANNCSNIEPEPIFVTCKYLLYDLRGWIGEIFLRKQVKNNVVSHKDIFDVHKIYQPKNNRTEMTTLVDIYNYIEPLQK